MRKLLLFFVSCLFVSPAWAQFVDVDKIGAQTSSHSIMFHPEVAKEKVMASTQKSKEQPKKRGTIAPKKNVQPTGVSLFKPGDAKIMAVVNGDAISSADVESYARLFMFNTGVPLNNKTKPMIINKVLRSAIDEKIKRQEVEKNQMTLSDKDLTTAIAQYEKSRHLPYGGLNKELRKRNINPEIFKQQMKTEILWARLIRRKVLLESNITQREVEDAIMRSKEDMKSPKYNVSEIVIPVKKAKNIDVLVDNIRRDGIFNMYAAQFSQSPSSANGGSLGWLKEGQLPAPLEAKIKKMKVGQVSAPVKYEDNYYILKLDDKFTPTGKEKEITLDDMKNVLETERYESLSAKYLQNLRQKSIIEFKS